MQHELQSNSDSMTQQGFYDRIVCSICDASMIL
jgi:hypothetical protein